VLFWDFDGVIKESVDVKTRAYVSLFKQFGTQLTERVRKHHEQNGGMSRFEKIPLYLSWAETDADQTQVARYCDLFSSEVCQAVIDSAWVPGAREYLLTNQVRQTFVIVTGTPQGEMEVILSALGIAGCFAEVHGAPTPKADAITLVLSRLQCQNSAAMMIGDSDSDYQAAKAAKIDFLLRRTRLNGHIQRLHTGAQCQDFLHG
jgi:phosphoglycolate phosphatase-like HAD superfamily hydrolase